MTLAEVFWKRVICMMLRKNKLQYVRHERKGDLRILRFWKKLKVYMTKCGKRRCNLDVPVMKESKGEVKGVQTSGLQCCDPTWKNLGGKDFRNLTLSLLILNQSDNSVHYFSKSHTSTSAEQNSLRKFRVHKNMHEIAQDPRDKIFLAPHWPFQTEIMWAMQVF